MRVHRNEKAVQKLMKIILYQWGYKGNKKKNNFYTLSKGVHRNEKKAVKNFLTCFFYNT